MSELDYVKVLLFAYPGMDALERAVSVSVDNKAALSFKDRLPALESAERIVAEMAIRSRISRAKGLLDRALAHMTAEELLLFEYKYFRRKKKLAEAECVFEGSERSYYRRQRETLSKFAHILARFGYREKEFLHDFAEFSPYMRIYDALKSGRESTIVARRNRRKINFISAQKSEVSSLCRTSERLPRRTKAAIPTTATHRTHMTVICTAVSGDEPAGSFCGGGVSAEV